MRNDVIINRCPKVSVVIPVYNTKTYLEQCVVSVITQTFKDLDILLIDDGSTDGSSDLCDQLAASDKRIRVIHKENEGVSAARNLGLDEATGEYVMLLDSDDWLDMDAVETLVKKADSESTDVLHFNYIREFEGKSLVKANTFLEEKLYTGEECKVVCRQLLGLTGRELAHPESMNFLASCGLNFYRNSLLKELGVRFVSLQEIGSFEDGFFNFNVFLHVKRFAFIDCPFYHYRKTNVSSCTSNYRKEYVARQLLLFDKIRVVIDKEGCWDYFSEAYYNRIALSTMEACLNAMCNQAGFRACFHEIGEVLRNEQFKKAYESFDISQMSFKWKFYFFFIKHSMVLPTYMMTRAITILKNRGAA